MKQSLLCLLIVMGLMTSCHHPRPIARKAMQKEESSPMVVSERINPKGIFFEAEKLPSTYIESVGQVATFKLVVRGAPEEQKFMLASRNLGGPLKNICEYEADDGGCLGRHLDAGTMMLDNDIWLMFDFFKGEPVEYVLTSKNPETTLVARFVPYPIKATGADGAEVHIRRLVPDARLMICEGEGFLPDEEVYVSSQSSNERTVNIPYICKNGRFSMVLEPQASGRSGGVAYLEIRRAYDRLILDYDWGCQALNPRRREANSSKMRHDALSKLSTDLDK